MSRRSVVVGAAAIAAAAKARGSARPGPLDALAAKLKGRLAQPGDADFDALRRVRSFNPETDKRPLAIARCADADDVARAIEAARTSSLDLAVRAGGADVLGASDLDGGLLIDLSAMTSIAVDPDHRTARVGPGVLSGAFTRAAGEHGLAPVLGCNPIVGVSGLTLGGGIGWFAGTHGAACDHLISADLVTAEGAQLSVDAAHRADLFWAIRGGGGNFGVVTSLEFRLFEVDQVLGGALAFPVETPGSFAALLRFYRDFMPTAPDALSVELNVAQMGKPVVLALVCWSGDLGEGARAIAPLRSFAKPIFDTVRPAPYAQLADAGGALPPNLFWRGGSLDSLSDAAIAELERALRVAPVGWNIGLGHVMRGQIIRPGDAETAMIRRAGQMSYFIGAGWAKPGQGRPGMDWVRASMAAMRPLSSARTYVNYLSDDSDPAVRAAYADNFERLRWIKRRYDPTNLFRHNRNIRP